MKRAVLILLLVIVAIPVFQCCKKGDNDPFISFRSRKARLVGEWTLKEGNLTETGSNGITYNYVYTDSNYKIMQGTVSILTYPYSETISIKKDGTYKKVVNKIGNITTKEGTWYFGRRNKEMDIKNKETVWFTAKIDDNGNDPFTYSGTDALNATDVWLIDELKNKEIIVKINGTTTISGSPISRNGTLTYIQK